MTLTTYPPNKSDPFAAVLAIGDSWFWYPKGSLISAVMALKPLKPDYTTAHILGQNGALLSEYRTGKYSAFWRNELTPQNFHFSLVLISGGGNDSVDYQFTLKKDCQNATLPRDCFNLERLHLVVDSLTGTMAALVSDVQIAAKRAGIRTPPVILNGYDRPVPDGRGFSPIGGEKFKFGGPWIAPALDRAGVAKDIEFRKEVIGFYIDTRNEAIQHLASRMTGVYSPFQLGTLRRAAATYKQDWDNELHPTNPGFRKLAGGPWLQQLAALGFTDP